MLWDQYVFRRGADVEDMWDSMFRVRREAKRPVRLLYIAGRGFDMRAQGVMSKFADSLKASGCEIEKADLLLVGFKDYQLSSELQEQTEANAAALKATFRPLGEVDTLMIGTEAEGEDDISAGNALRLGTAELLGRVSDQTDIVLDVSSLPRIAYLSFMLGLLELLTDAATVSTLSAKGVNFQVLVGEDAALDSHIQSEDPSNNLVLIPGYSSALQVESMQDWPLVWFPVLGENRTAQLQKVMSVVPELAEICPVLPHPSRDLRRGDKLLLEYRSLLFDTRETPLSNVLYAHEAHPFEAYRQLLGAMTRYRQSMTVVGGCRLVVTPLASKLITLGAALACFEMKFQGARGPLDYSVAIPYAEPRRYVASPAMLQQSKPDISALVLTGEAYAY
ncbi:MAG: allophanate hydrolase subunit 1 [Herminiimonas sp.]|nr:allophanate hydrolase subunit 1 [Herminiimonas sp.]